VSLLLLLLLLLYFFFFLSSVSLFTREQFVIGLRATKLARKYIIIELYTEPNKVWRVLRKFLTQC
jgi:hypothetical protein